MSSFVVPIELIAAAFFTVIALMFVGLGQSMGRAFRSRDGSDRRLLRQCRRQPGGDRRIRPGILSSNRSGGMVRRRARGRSSLTGANLSPQVYALIGFLVLLATAATRDGGRFLTYWSPYYKVTYHPRSGMIETNNIGHQVIVDVHKDGPAYSLPHLLNRDAGGRPFDDVLVVERQAGNDVSAALWHGAKTVDAVEIDPSIYRLGRVDHPNRPYSDPRVSIHLDDGRNFVKKSRRSYDLATYALVDSLVLHSGYSSVRLESFLFTEQAFRDIKAKLKPGGAFVMYNAYRQGWVVGRLALLAEKVFGTRPIVLSLPHVQSISAADNLGTRVTCLIAGMPGSPFLERVRESFAANESFWLASVPEVGASVNGFGHDNPRVAGFSGTWAPIRPVIVDTSAVGPLPSDEWPFLYLRERVIPGLNLRFMAIVAAISAAILLAFAPVRAARPNARMFFLGAGFMLLESKGVVHMALLFGSTWVVNSVVFAAILVLILVANLYVAVFRPRAVRLPYVLLGAALAVNILVPMSAFLHLSGGVRIMASCLVVFAPVLFAGVIFAVTFRDCVRPDIAMGSNVAGVILGGSPKPFPGTWL